MNNDFVLLLESDCPLSLRRQTLSLTLASPTRCLFMSHPGVGSMDSCLRNNSWISVSSFPKRSCERRGCGYGELIVFTPVVNQSLMVLNSPHSISLSSSGITFLMLALTHSLTVHIHSAEVDVNGCIVAAVGI